MLLLAYLASMAVMVPLTLLPQKLLSFLGCPRARRERLALETAEFWARWLLRLIPFCELRCIPPRCAEDGESRTACRPDPEPSIWVCNHTSNLDFLLLLAADYRLRGRRKRPMKIVYVSCLPAWEGVRGAEQARVLWTSVCLLWCLPTHAHLLTSFNLLSATTYTYVSGKGSKRIPS